MQTNSAPQPSGQINARSTQSSALENAEYQACLDMRMENVRELIYNGLDNAARVAYGHILTTFGKDYGMDVPRNSGSRLQDAGSIFSSQERQRL
jgi:hypothetical protein